MRYAVIENGVIVNFIFLSPFDAENFPDCIPIGDYLVNFGDEYKDGYFYRNGERVLTAIEILEKEKEEMREALELLGVTIDAE